MKAQSWRKILGLSNAALVLGILGAGGWWFTKVRPASASAANLPEWAKKAFTVYQGEAKGAHSQTIWPVGEEAIKQITRPDDLMNPPEKGGPYVWAYIGPPPPPKKTIDPVTEVKGPPPPSGLEVLGKPVILFSDPNPKGSVVVTWLFKDTPPGKGAVTIAKGDPFITAEDTAKRADKDKKKGRFKLKDGWHVPMSAGADRKVLIVYGVYDESDKLLSTDFKEFVLASDAPKIDIVGASPSSTSGGANSGPGKPSTIDLGVAPPLAEVHVVVQSTSASSRRIEADENVWRYIRYTDVDKLLGEVKTEDAKDEKGNPSGVKISGVDSGSFASQFDVKPGDVLKSINGTPVHSRSEAVTVVKALPKDIANVQVVIERNGRQIAYDVDPRDPKVRGAGGKVKFDNK